MKNLHRRYLSDIAADCAGELNATAYPCKAIDFGFPIMLAFMNPTGTLAVAGDAPTLAEIQAGLADTGVNRLILIEEFTNGKRLEAGRVEETGADTADGLTNVVSINMKIEGKIKRLNQTTINDLLKLNPFPRLKMWVITSKGYIFGGKTGYRTTNFFTPLIMEGYGTANFIPVDHEYQHNLNKTEDIGQNDGFLLLTNPATT